MRGHAACIPDRRPAPQWPLISLHAESPGAAARGRRVAQELWQPGGAQGSVAGSGRRRAGRVHRAERRRQDDASDDSRRDPGAGCWQRAQTRPHRLGAAAAGAVREVERRREPAAVRPARGCRGRRGHRRADARRDGARRPCRRAGGTPFGREQAACEHRDRAVGQPARALARRAERLARPPAARATVALHRRARGARNERRVLHSRSLGGGAVCNPRARAGRRGAPLLGYAARARGAGRGRRERSERRLRWACRLRGGLRGVSAPAGSLNSGWAPVRWLLLKDLQILRRSPLMVAVLVVYPVLVALLIGFALSRGPDKPTVAVLNQVPRGEKLTIGDQTLSSLLGGGDLSKRVRTVNVTSRADAERKVRDGDALAALIIPPDTFQKAGSQLDQGQVDVLLNEEDPVKGRLVDDAISSLIAEQNRRLSRALIKTNLQYLQLLLTGGTVNVLGAQFTVLGLRRIAAITRAARRELPRGSPIRSRLDQVIRFNELAQKNFGVGGEALAAVGEPIKIRKQILGGSRVPLTSFAAAVAVAVSLLVLTVLLASRSLARRRPRDRFLRLRRCPGPRG